MTHEHSLRLGEFNGTEKHAGYPSPDAGVAAWRTARSPAARAAHRAPDVRWGSTTARTPAGYPPKRFARPGASVRRHRQSSIDATSCSAIVIASRFRAIACRLRTLAVELRVGEVAGVWTGAHVACTAGVETWAGGRLS